MEGSRGDLSALAGTWFASSERTVLRVRQLIRELGKSKTVLVSTHILQEVQPVADRGEPDIDTGQRHADAIGSPAREMR